MHDPIEPFILRRISPGVRDAARIDDLHEDIAIRLHLINGCCSGAFACPAQLAQFIAAGVAGCSHSYPVQHAFCLSDTGIRQLHLAHGDILAPFPHFFPQRRLTPPAAFLSIIVRSFYRANHDDFLAGPGQRDIEQALFLGQAVTVQGIMHDLPGNGMEFLPHTGRAHRHTGTDAQLLMHWVDFLWRLADIRKLLPHACQYDDSELEPLASVDGHDAHDILPLAERAGRTEVGIALLHGIDVAQEMEQTGKAGLLILGCLIDEHAQIGLTQQSARQAAHIVVVSRLAIEIPQELRHAVPAGIVAPTSQPPEESANALAQVILCRICCRALLRELFDELEEAVICHCYRLLIISSCRLCRLPGSYFDLRQLRRGESTDR